MIARILTYLFFGFLIVAFLLSFAGIHEVYLGNGFTSWLRDVNDSFNGWSFAIPRIPDIPLINTGDTFVRSHLRATQVVTTPVWTKDSGKNIFELLISMVNMFITFLNFIVKLLNVIITIINVLIQVIQFVLTMVWKVKDLPQYLSVDEWTRWNNESSVWWWRDVGNLSFGG